MSDKAAWLLLESGLIFAALGMVAARAYLRPLDGVGERPGLTLLDGELHRPPSDGHAERVARMYLVFTLGGLILAAVGAWHLWT